MVDEYSGGLGVKKKSKDNLTVSGQNQELLVPRPTRRVRGVIGSYSRRRVLPGGSAVRLGKQISQPLSRRNPKPGPVGRNPLSLRIWISGSISAWVVPAWHTKYRIPCVPSQVPS